MTGVTGHQVIVIQLVGFTDVNILQVGSMALLTLGILVDYKDGVMQRRT